MPKRVVFTFDPSSLASLKRVTARGGFSSMGSAVREGIQTHEILNDQADFGFTELLVRDVKTHKQKQIIVPSIMQQIRPKTT